jgi:hypothetical protein
VKFYNNKALAGASGQGGYFIDRSLRFRSSASAYLNRTPASAGNRKTWTWSAWVKKSTTAANFGIFSADNTGASNSYLILRFNNSDELSAFQYTGSAYNFNLATNAVFRDVSAWYHVLIAVDTTQATDTNRIKFYVNGVQQSSLRLTTYPTQNLDTYVNASSFPHSIGSSIGGTTSPDMYFDGYMTEVNFIDGQALDPTSFGETDATTGVWKPISYSGTYGTNGFYLNFSDNTSTTTLGYDTSGNGNNWTANNISVTSGATYDSMTDVPTLTSEDAANYCTMNPVNSYAGLNTNGNLTITGNGNWQTSRATFGNSAGKWYWEVTMTGAGNTIMVGVDDNAYNIQGNPSSSYVGAYTNSWSLYFSNGQIRNNTTSGSAYGSSFVTGDICMVALDMDNGKIYWGKNGTWFNSGNPATQTNPAYTNLSGYTLLPAISCFDSASIANANFGQRPFTYTPPAGFKSLNTYNLPDSTIVDGSEYFNTLTYSGNGTNATSITGVGFQPDLVWAKARNLTQHHALFDSVRGATYQLFSSLPASETNYTSISQSLDSDGFTVGTSDYINGTGYNYVAWNWKANGSGVSNTDGSITSTVSANTTAGFSIVTYTGTGSAATVGHGLGVAPSMIIWKNRDNSNRSWATWHTSIAANEVLFLNATNVKGTNTAIMNSTAPTASVFSLGGAGHTNDSGEKHVAYCFADVEGYSKFGSYSSNASADGPFVYLGFKPAFVMFKKATGSTNANAGWYMFDTSRGTYNVIGPSLRADLGSYVEYSFDVFDILSNGFKIRRVDISVNSSTAGDTYIYMAFAENPFKNSLAR